MRAAAALLILTLLAGGTRADETVAELQARSLHVRPGAGAGPRRKPRLHLLPRAAQRQPQRATLEPPQPDHLLPHLPQQHDRRTRRSARPRQQAVSELSRRQHRPRPHARSGRHRPDPHEPPVYAHPGRRTSPTICQTITPSAFATTARFPTAIRRFARWTSWTIAFSSGRAASWSARPATTRTTTSSATSCASPSVRAPSAPPATT